MVLTAEAVPVIHCLERDDPRWDNYHGNLERGGEIPPWESVFRLDTNYNYVLCGPTGGGKTGSAIYLALIQAVVRGAPVYSNIPFHWYAYDVNGKKYEYQSLDFDVRSFIEGDEKYWDSWVIIDEGNFNMDSKKIMSNMNVGMTDILQEGRKMGMSIIFTVINPRWLDPRFTGALLDIAIQTHDLYHTEYGKSNGLGKGEVVKWDMWDQTGKYQGTPGRYLGSVAFALWMVWNTWNTRHFINPLEARKRVRFNHQLIDYGKGILGESMPQDGMEQEIKEVVDSLRAEGHTSIRSNDLWSTLGYEAKGIRSSAGQVLRRLGVRIRRSNVRGDWYDLSRMDLPRRNENDGAPDDV